MSETITAIPLEINPRHIEINIDNLQRLAETVYEKLEMLEKSLSPILSYKLLVDDKLDLLAHNEDNSLISNRLASICNVLVECDLIIVNISKRLEI